MANGEDPIVAIKVVTEGADRAAADLGKSAPVIRDTTVAIEEQTAAVKENAAAKSVPVRNGNLDAGLADAGGAADLRKQIAGAAVEKEINDELQKRRLIEDTINEALGLRAAGRHAEALAVEHEAEEMALALQLQRRTGVSEAEALAMAKARLTEQRAIAAAKAAEVAETRALAGAEAEAAGAAALRAREEAAASRASNRGLARAGTGLGITGLRGGLKMALPFLAAEGIREMTIGVAKSEEEFRKLQRAGAEAAESIAEKMRIDPVAALGEVHNALKTINREFTDLADKNVFSKLWNDALEGFGQKGDTDKMQELRNQHDVLVQLGHQASAAAQAESKMEQQALALKISGMNAAAAQIERQIKLQKELEGIAQRHKANDMDSVGDAAAKKRDAARETAEAIKKFGEEQEEAEERRAEKAAAATADLLEQAHLQEVITHGTEEEAAHLREVIELGKKLLEIQRLRTAGEITDADVATRTGALAQTMRDKEAERARKRDEEFDKRKGDAEAELHIAEARERNDQVTAGLLALQKHYTDEIANIYKSHLLPAQKQELANLEAANNHMQRLAILRDKWVSDFDARKADRNKTPQQREQERQARQKDRQDDRAIASQQVNYEASKGKFKNQAEYDARLKELLGDLRRPLTEQADRARTDEKKSRKDYDDEKHRKVAPPSPPPNARKPIAPAAPSGGSGGSYAEEFEATQRAAEAKSEQSPPGKFYWDTEPVAEAAKAAGDQLVQSVASLLSSLRTVDVSQLAKVIDGINAKVDAQQAQIENLQNQ